MSLVTKSLNRFTFGQLLSQTKIDRAERRLKAKKEQLDDIKNELRLLEEDAYRTYITEVRYDRFPPTMIEKARKWFDEMLNNKNFKIDKRKKYEEKEVFDWLIKNLRNTFEQPDIEITEFSILGYGHTADIIYFTCKGHKFVLQIPIIQNVSFKDYQDESDYVFKIRLHSNEKECIHEFVGATFEEDELKDILNKYLKQLNKETINEET